MVSAAGGGDPGEPPQHDELGIYLVTPRVTSGCLVDCLEHWWEDQEARFAQVGMLVLNPGNGSESHSHRTQFMGQLVDFVARHGISVCLAYHPPSRTMYNPVGRC